MANTTRQELTDYCLRRLGFPVIEINVDDDQVNDRIDDAIQFWQEYHFDGSEKVYIKHKLTGSALKLSAALADNFTVGETLTGATSGATARVVSVSTDTITVDNVNSTFSNSESITGSLSVFTASLSSTNAFVKGDLENGYIPISSNILGVTRMFKFGGIGAGTSSDGLFDVDYQFALQDMYNLLSADLTYYAQVKTHMNLLESLFVNDRSIRFNRKTDRMYIDTNMDTTFNVGDYIIAEGMALVSGADYAEVYDDLFLKKYATALIKRQWGENMKKFAGIQMPGGVTLNGVEIYQEAVTEINAIEDEMQLRYELPPAFIVG
tara:strand:+ start:2650 stop:3615 length:966 start_codon:yes stop_codon:yes gene_type:complete